MLFTGGTLVWVPLLEAVPMPEWFGTGMKMGFIASVRVIESVLGNVFVWANKPFYSTYVLAERRPWGMRRVNDQRLAGSMMMVEGSIVTLARARVVLHASRRPKASCDSGCSKSGLDPRAVRRAVRYGRAQEMEQPR